VRCDELINSNSFHSNDATPRVLHINNHNSHDDRQRIPNASRLCHDHSELLAGASSLGLGTDPMRLGSCDG